MILRDNLHTNIHRAHYTGISNLCTFCNIFRETVAHLLWDCHVVRAFRTDVNNALTNNFFFLKLIPNTGKDRILGNRFSNADNFGFIFYTYVSRFVWITKLRQTDLDLNNFKNYINNALKIQKSAGILTCLENLDIDNLWL